MSILLSHHIMTIANSKNWKFDEIIFSKLLEVLDEVSKEWSHSQILKFIEELENKE